MDDQRRMTLEEIEERHPRCCRRCASIHTSAGSSFAQTSTGRSCSARAGRATSESDRSRATIPSHASRRTRGATCCVHDGFMHVADIMVGSFYDPVLDEAARSRS
jgi:hypothetical protein